MFQQRSPLKNLTDPGVRRLLSRVKQLMAFDGQIEVWAHGFSFANAFSHLGLSHPLLLGVNAKALSGFPGFLGTVFTGAIWSTVYLKTHSLRWPFLSHFVADLLSVSIIVFLNRAILAG